MFFLTKSEACSLLQLCLFQSKLPGNYFLNVSASFWQVGLPKNLENHHFLSQSSSFLPCSFLPSAGRGHCLTARPFPTPATALNIPSKRCCQWGPEPVHGLPLPGSSRWAEHESHFCRLPASHLQGKAMGGKRVGLSPASNTSNELQTPESSRTARTEFSSRVEGSAGAL